MTFCNICKYQILRCISETNNVICHVSQLKEIESIRTEFGEYRKPDAQGGSQMQWDRDCSKGWNFKERE